MARLTVVRGPLCFCLVRPYVRPSMGVKNFFLSKNTFYGVLRRFGVFLTFSIFVRACVTLYVLSFVDWTCPRVLVLSTWNLFRSTIYELKLCTSYFWSTSVHQNGRNIASHSGVLVIFFFNLVDWTCPRVLVQSTWNLSRSTVYELKLCTSYFWSMSIRPSGRSEHSPRQHFSDLYDFLSMFCHELILGFWSDQSETYMYVIYMGWSCAPPLEGGVASVVFLWEGSELSPPQHFNDLSDNFF